MLTVTSPQITQVVYKFTSYSTPSRGIVANAPTQSRCQALILVNQFVSVAAYTRPIPTDVPGGEFTDQDKDNISLQ